MTDVNTAPNTVLKTADAIVAEDLADIANRLSAEFGKMSGKRLLIVGGAGFLG